jgi:hypothetical protein
LNNGTNCIETLLCDWQQKSHFFASWLTRGGQASGQIAGRKHSGRRAV